MKRTEDRPVLGERAERPTRIPIHGRRGVLDVYGQEEGYHYFWANDLVNGTDDNIDKYLDAGYEFVTHSVTVGHRRVNDASGMGAKVSKAVGNGVTAYLLRCPMEVYHEELALMNKAAMDPVREMKASLNKKEEGKYGSVVISDKEIV